MKADDLRAIKSFPSLVKYLRDELSWPIETEDFDDLTFDYSPEELGLDAKTAAKVKEIKQMRPLPGAKNQPWGIFFINFEPKRLPVVALRRILGHLVLRKRSSANKSERPAWNLHDLLFISSYGESEHRDIAFAHFADDPTDKSDLPVLRVLGWDDEDTVLHLDHANKMLSEKLRWPAHPDEVALWRSNWSAAFVLKHNYVIKTSKDLSIQMAQLATRIRKRVNKALSVETESGPLRTLMRAFREALIHDLVEDDFADMYAQTITYGLLSARVSRPAALIAENVVDMVPITNPFLRDLLSTFLTIGGRKGKIDFDELGINDVVQALRDVDMEAVLRDFGDRNPQEDPVIHFYELFLKEYDAKKRMQRGVFYTPRPVVSYIVRSVHELLQTEFGLVDGLADTATWADMLKRNKSLSLPEIEVVDPKTRKVSRQPIDPQTPFVQILDPATGTATFLVEVIDIIFKTMSTKWTKEGHGVLWLDKKWNEYVPRHLLPRLHGYELMMAPYAIAHMKIGLKLFETGYKFGSGERARIYLTNTLEPAHDFSDSFEQMAPALAHEATAVNRVKRFQRFTVVIGNPPYSGISSNMSEFAQHIVDAYKYVDGAALNERKLWLQDDYVKFIRTSQTTIEAASIGVFGFITNHGYLDNTTFRGMRQSLMNTYGSLRVLDLHGNTTKSEQSPDGLEDKNVFDIKQGVAICLATRGGSRIGVCHGEMWGTREAKYALLGKSSARSGNFAPLSPDSPYYFFEPQNIDHRDEYDRGWRLNDMMPVNCAGFITARDHFVVDFDRDTLLSRVGDFANPAHSNEEVRKTYFAGCGSSKYPDGDSRGWKVPAARKRVMGDKQWRDRVRQCSYRPFDMRFVYWADWMVDWPRPEVSGHMLAGPNVALHVCRQSVSESWAHILVARGLVDDCYVSNKSRERGYAHPLYLYGSDDSLAFGGKSKPKPNFAPAYLEQLATALNVDKSEPHGMPTGCTPEDVFHYIYAICHSPQYRMRYADSLKIDFPRVGLPRKFDLFRALARLGKEMAEYHLLESQRENSSIAIYSGVAHPEMEKVSYASDTVWLDKGQTRGFTRVPETVWNFHIGGYQVCEKWLKDRKGRTLSNDDIAHYQKIVVALNETIRLMKEIDEVIEKHGGWPGAFVTASSPAAPATLTPDQKGAE
jgi:predicted helicase